MTINQSPIQPTPVGAFRFNTDSSKMEYYDGNQWVNITSTSPEAQTGGTRGMTAAGSNPGALILPPANNARVPPVWASGDVEVIFTH